MSTDQGSGETSERLDQIKGLAEGALDFAKDVVVAAPFLVPGANQVGPVPDVYRTEPTEYVSTSQQVSAEELGDQQRAWADAEKGRLRSQQERAVEEARDSEATTSALVIERSDVAHLGVQLDESDCEDEPDEVGRLGVEPDESDYEGEPDAGDEASEPSVF